MRVRHVCPSFGCIVYVLCDGVSQTRFVHLYMSLFVCVGSVRFRFAGNNPFDVVKTRMQGSNSHQYSSMLDCVMKVRCFFLCTSFSIDQI